MEDEVASGEGAMPNVQHINDLRMRARVATVGPAERKAFEA